VATDQRFLDDWREESLCSVCPALKVGLGCFDVVERPGRDYRYDPAVGYRVDVGSGVAVCVHPFRVGLPAGRYATDGVSVSPVAEPLQPSVAQLALPEQVDDLEAWFVARLRVVEPAAMASALDDAEAIASQRFSPGEVVAAMRRVLAYELRG
jgi:hypothetical protein